jgi:hypothetical protein
MPSSQLHEAFSHTGHPVHVLQGLACHYLPCEQQQDQEPSLHYYSLPQQSQMLPLVKDEDFDDDDDDESPIPESNESLDYIRAQAFLEYFHRKQSLGVIDEGNDEDGDERDDMSWSEPSNSIRSINDIRSSSKHTIETSVKPLLRKQAAFTSFQDLAALAQESSSSPSSSCVQSSMSAPSVSSVETHCSAPEVIPDDQQQCTASPSWRRKSRSSNNMTVKADCYWRNIAVRERKMNRKYYHRSRVVSR